MHGRHLYLTSFAPILLNKIYRKHLSEKQPRGPNRKSCKASLLRWEILFTGQIFVMQYTNIAFMQKCQEEKYCGKSAIADLV